MGTTFAAGTTIKSAELNANFAEKAPLASPTFTGTVTIPTLIGTTITATTIVTASLSCSNPMGISSGGTGQATKTSAFDALSPMTTAGDIVIGGASGTGTRLAGAAGVLQGAAGSGPSYTQAPTLTTPSMTTPTISTSINLTGGQITFPSTQSSSSNANTLDDYEEGTWTPVVSGTTLAGAGTYTIQVGHYVKIGRMVYIAAYVVISNHTGTGNMTWSGLPFASLSTTNFYSTVAIGYTNTLTTPANTIPQMYINPNNTTFEFSTVTVAGGAAGAIAVDTAFGIMFSGCYEAAT